MALSHQNSISKRALKAPVSAPRDAFSNPSEDSLKALEEAFMSV